MIFKNQSKTLFKLIIISAIFSLVFIPLISSAQSPGAKPYGGVGSTPTPSSDAFGKGLSLTNLTFEGLMNTILNNLVKLASLVFSLGAYLINLALQFNSQLMNMKVIHAGWAVTRDIANLGFVLGILVIAFGTITRSREYGMQSLLVKFITMAILINFSLVIAGIILDFTGIMTAFFINAATDGTGDLGTSLAALSDIKYLNQVDGFADASWIAKGTSETLIEIGSLLFIVIFIVLSTIVFLGIAIMLLTRFITLAFLLVLAPIAWFTSIFPRIDQSKKWWSTFNTWAFYAPISAFFLYLAVKTIKVQGELATLQAKGGGSIGIDGSSDAVGQALASNSLIAGVGGQIGSLVVVLGFLFGSLIAASKTGDAGSKMAMGWANGVKNWTIGKMKGTAVGVGTLAARGAVGGARGTSRKLGVEKWAQDQQKAAQEGRLKGLTGKIRGLAAGGIQRLQKTSERRSIDKYEKDVANISANDLARQYAIAMDPAKKAAIIKKAIKDGKLDKLPENTNFDLYEKYGGDLGDLSKANVLFSKDKDKNKSILDIIKNVKDKNNLTNDEKKNLEKALSNKLSNMTPEDFTKGNWSKVVDGLNLNALGLTKDQWEKGGFKTTLLNSLSMVKGKELGKMMGKSTKADRTKISNLLLSHATGLSKDDLLKKMGIDPSLTGEDLEKAYSGALKDFDLAGSLTKEEIKKAESYNSSLYKYSKTIHSATGEDGSDKETNKKEEKETISDKPLDKNMDVAL